MGFKPIRFVLSEHAGVNRVAEPVSFGVPLSFGYVGDIKDLALIDETGAPLPFDTRVLARWPDNSVRWVLVDTQISIPAGRDKIILLCAKSSPVPQLPRIMVRDLPGGLNVDTGKASFCIGMQKELSLFKRIRINGSPELEVEFASLKLTDTGEGLDTDGGSILI